jgi:hypothetical protein
MRKIDQKAEKRARNELYAEKYRKTRDRRKRHGTFKNWCRVKGHPATCSCNLFSREELITLGRR